MHHPPTALPEAESGTAATARHRPREGVPRRGAPPAAARYSQQARPGPGRHLPPRGGPPGGEREKQEGGSGRNRRANGTAAPAAARAVRLTSRCAPAPPWPLGACVVQPTRFHGSGSQQCGRRAQPLVPRLAAMSVPEVEALVSQKYEIKRRLGKGVSARGARGAGRRGAGLPCGPSRQRLCLQPPGPCAGPSAASGAGGLRVYRGEENLGFEIVYYA